MNDPLHYMFVTGNTTLLLGMVVQPQPELNEAQGISRSGFRNLSITSLVFSSLLPWSRLVSILIEVSSCAPRRTCSSTYQTWL